MINTAMTIAGTVLLGSLIEFMCVIAAYCQCGVLVGRGLRGSVVLVTQCQAAD